MFMSKFFFENLIHVFALRVYVIDARMIRIVIFSPLFIQVGVIFLLKILNEWRL